MPNVTIVIACAPYHTELLSRAVKSANAQTVTCEVFVYEDTELKGAGYARNKALAEVESDFVIFLDADDQIAPNFVERCVSVWKHGHYVYTDWMQEDGIHKASDNPWQAHNGEWHVLTTLLRTEDVRRVGGFDETLPGGEDSYLYWALTRSGICGIHLHEPLFTYGKEGRRARAFVQSPAYAPTMLKLIERYGEEMCCGGDGLKENFTPDQPGDVEALALWGGNRRERGPVTGRLYPRGGNLNPMSVAPQDIDAAPHLWQRVYKQPAPVQPPPQPAILAHERPQPKVILPANKVLDGVGQLVEARYGVKVPAANEVVKTAADLKAELPATVKPNVSKVRKMAGKGKK